jgi:pimeloyl-ACP methyl ester carboxylesterase
MTGTHRIVAMGRSLGTGVAVHLASQRPLAGAILVTPYDSMVAVAQVHYPLLPVGLLLRAVDAVDRAAEGFAEARRVLRPLQLAGRTMTPQRRFVVRLRHRLFSIAQQSPKQRHSEACFAPSPPMKALPKPKQRSN